MNKNVLEVRVPEPQQAVGSPEPREHAQDFETVSFPAARCEAVFEEIRDELDRVRDDGRRPVVAVVGPRWCLMLKAYLEERSSGPLRRSHDDMRIEGVPIRTADGMGPGVVAPSDSAGGVIRDWAEGG